MNNRSASFVPLHKELLHPVECADLVRLGSRHDGGYVVPASSVRNARWLLGLGLSDNWDFERDFLRECPGARIIGVDHTVTGGFLMRRILRGLWKMTAYTLIRHRRKAAAYAQEFQRASTFRRFFRPPNRHLCRRVASPAETAVDITLEELLDGMPGTGSPDVFLKMDIEGSEYQILPEIVRHQHRFTCIAAEFHHLDTQTAVFNAAIRELSGPFRLVHVHGNNCGPYDQIHDFPATVELTWVPARGLADHPRAAPGPHPHPDLDRPNDPGRPDHPIRLGDHSSPSRRP